MTQTQYIINRKLNILELGEVLGNISEACRTLGISRQHYYDIRTAIEEEGLDGLLEKSRCAPRPSNRVAPHIEQAVLDYSMDFPTHGHVRVANGERDDIYSLCSHLSDASIDVDEQIWRQTVKTSRELHGHLSSAVSPAIRR